MARSPVLSLLLALLALSAAFSAADTALPAWLRARGASVAPVSIGTGPTYSSPETTFSRPGLWADASIAAGDVIATIPSSLLLYFDSSFAPSSAVGPAAATSAAAASAASAAWQAPADTPAAHMGALLGSLHATNLSDPYALLSARVLYERTVAKEGGEASDLFAPHSPFPAPPATTVGVHSGAGGRVGWPASGLVMLPPSSIASLHLSPSAAASSPLPTVAAEHTALASRMATVLSGLVTPDLSNKVIASLRDPKHAAAAAAAAGAGVSAQPGATPEAIAAEAAELAKLDPITETPFAKALPHGPEGLSAEAFAAAYAQTLASALFVPVRGTNPAVASTTPPTDKSKEKIGEWTVALAPLLTVVNHQTATAAASSSSPLGLGVAPETAAALGAHVSTSAPASKGPSAALRLRLSSAHGRPAAASTDFVLELVALRGLDVGDQVTVDLGQMLHDPPAASAVATAAATAGASSGAVLPLPPSLTPNAVLLLHFGAALPLNPHEGVLLEVQTTAPALPSLPSDAPPAAAAAAATAAADAEARAVLLQKLLGLNKLPTAASLTVTTPVRKQPAFHQALRAAQLSLRELKELDKHIGLRFEAGKGFFSLHNELAALLGVFEAMDVIVEGTTVPPTSLPAQSDPATAADKAGKDEKKGDPLAEERNWVRKVRLEHNSRLNTSSAAPVATPEGDALVWEGLRSAYRSATARSVRAVALDALAGVADVFADLSRRWARDAAAAAGDADAPEGVRAAAGKWRAEIAAWEKEAREWVGKQEKWAKELLAEP